MAEDLDNQKTLDKQVEALIESLKQVKTIELLIIRIADYQNLLSKAGISFSEVMSLVEKQVKQNENRIIESRIIEENNKLKAESDLEKLESFPMLLFSEEWKRLEGRHPLILEKADKHANKLEEVVNKSKDAISYLKRENVQGKDLDFSEFSGIVLPPEQIKEIAEDNEELKEHKKQLADYRKGLLSHRQRLELERQEVEKQIAEEKEKINKEGYRSDEIPKVHTKINVLEFRNKIKDKHINRIDNNLKEVEKKEEEVKKRSDKIDNELKKMAESKREFQKLAEKVKDRDPEKHKVAYDIFSLLDSQENAIKNGTLNITDLEKRNEFLNKVSEAEKAKEGTEKNNAKENKNQINTDNKKINPSKKELETGVERMQKLLNKPPVRNVPKFGKKEEPKGTGIV